MQQAISYENISTLQSGAYVSGTAAKAGFFSSFIEWCRKQETNRFLWLAISFLGHIGMVLPLTLYIIINSGNNFNLWIITCACNVPVLALNLAAQPLKITLPALFFAWLADAAIIIYALSIFFAH